MRLTRAQAAKLARLNAGESLQRSELSKPILVLLQAAATVRLEKSGSSYVVRGIPGKLAAFVEHQCGIRDLERYAQADSDNRTRELLSEVAGDSKALPHRPLDGILLRSFGNCLLADSPLGCQSPGTALLVSLPELDRLQIRSKCLIAIENVECLLHFEKVHRHFPDLAGADYTLILRWHWGEAWRRWLNGWSGQLLHFPDYDPAGLRIFTTEVLPFRADAKMMIPRSLETLLETRGNRDLYLRQEAMLPTTKDHADLASLCESLRKHRKALEQENLLL
jgi:hypothetical protein